MEIYGQSPALLIPFIPFIPFILFVGSWARGLVGSFHQSFWRRVRDLNLPSLKASHPEGAVFQGKLQFPGRVPCLALQPRERLYVLLQAHFRLRCIPSGECRGSWFQEAPVGSPLKRLWMRPSTPSHFFRGLVGSWARGLAHSISLAEGEGFEPPIPFRTPVFKTGAIGRSANPPRHYDRRGMGRRSSGEAARHTSWPSVAYVP